MHDVLRMPDNGKPVGLRASISRDETAQHRNQPAQNRDAPNTCVELEATIPTRLSVSLPGMRPDSGSAILVWLAPGHMLTRFPS